MIRGKLSRRAASLSGERVPFVVATVVRVQRPASVRPGDSALVLSDGRVEGFVGGVCAEPSVRLHGLRVLESGEPLLLRITPGDDTAPANEGAVTVQNPCLSGGALEIFLEPRLPAPRIVCVGETPIAEAIGTLGRDLGYEVQTGDPKAEPAEDCAALVVASHGGDEETPVSRALQAGIPYVGLVASRARGRSLVEALRRAGLSDDQLGRLHTPAGFAIAARTAEEIALSILAEIVASLRPATISQPFADKARFEDAGARQSAVDPVCGMSVAVSDYSLRLDYAGQTLFFCGDRCLTEFEREPARYAAAQ